MTNAHVQVNTQNQHCWLKRLQLLDSTDQLRQALRDKHPHLLAPELSRIIILGAAEEGQRLALLCSELNIDVVAIVDDNPALLTGEINGQQVQPSSHLQDLDKYIPVVIASHRVLGAYQRLLKQNFTRVVPFALLQTLEPERFPPHMFYDGLLEDLIDHRQEYEWLYLSLNDDASRQALDAMLGFRQTLSPEILTPVINNDLYYPSGLFQLSHHECYVDGGAFDGDSVRLFLRNCDNRFDQVFAFEPDPVTYQRLHAAFSKDLRIHTINQGLHQEATVLRFSDTGTRTAILKENGTREIPVTSIDHYLKNSKISYVKMNIEGAELQALHGAKNTIKQYAPKLAISAYHRPADLWQVPRLINALNPNYSLYLRQHDGGIIETVAYAVQK